MSIKPSTKWHFDSVKNGTTGDEYILTTYVILAGTGECIARLESSPFAIIPIWKTNVTAVPDDDMTERRAMYEREAKMVAASLRSHDPPRYSAPLPPAQVMGNPSLPLFTQQYNAMQAQLFGAPSPHGVNKSTGGFEQPSRSSMLMHPLSGCTGPAYKPVQKPAAMNNNHPYMKLSNNSGVYTASTGSGGGPYNMHRPSMYALQFDESQQPGPTMFPNVVPSQYVFNTGGNGLNGPNDDSRRSSFNNDSVDSSRMTPRGNLGAAGFSLMNGMNQPFLGYVPTPSGMALPTNFDQAMNFIKKFNPPLSAVSGANCIGSSNYTAPSFFGTPYEESKSDDDDDVAT